MTSFFLAFFGFLMITLRTAYRVSVPEDDRDDDDGDGNGNLAVQEEKFSSATWDEATLPSPDGIEIAIRK